MLEVEIGTYLKGWLLIEDWWTLHERVKS